MPAFLFLRECLQVHANLTQDLRLWVSTSLYRVSEHKGLSIPPLASNLSVSLLAVETRVMAQGRFKEAELILNSIEASPAFEALSGQSRQFFSSALLVLREWKERGVARLWEPGSRKAIYARRPLRN